VIKSVGIDLAGTGEHKVRCPDEGAQLYTGFCYQDGMDTIAPNPFPLKSVFRCEGLHIPLDCATRQQITNCSSLEPLCPLLAELIDLGRNYHLAVCLFRMA